MSKIRTLSLSLLADTGILLGFGLLVLYSVSPPWSSLRFADEGYLFKRQLVFLAIGLGLMFVAIFVDYRRLKKISVPALVLTFLLLILVFLPPISSSLAGAHRWLHLGIFTFQPADLAKLAIIIYLANILSVRKEPHAGSRSIVIPVLLTALIVVLLGLEPFVAASLIILGVALVMLWAGGFRKEALLVSIFSTVFVLFYSFFHWYQLAKLTSFWDPWKDPYTYGYQNIQSLIAIGHAGIGGAGYGLSIQKWLYLPDAYSGFIFSILAEELGLLGVLFLLLLFLGIAYLGIRISRQAPDTFGGYLAIGIASLISIQAILHIASCLSCIPVISVPLPFFSYGGSSLVFTLISVGILLGISKQSEAELKFEKGMYIFYGIAVIFILLFLRVFYIQAFKGDNLHPNAEWLIPADRGNIFDRNGIQLTETIESISVYAHPADIYKEGQDIDKISKLLSLVLDMPIENVRRRLNRKDLRTIWLKRQMLIDKGRIEKLGISGIGIIKEPKRWYPKEELAGHLIGFVGVDYLGLEGIEYLFNNELRGEPGVYLVGATGKKLPDKYPATLPLKGRDIILTIDSNLQSIAENALNEGVKNSHAKGGIVIIMNPYEGEVLSLAINPPFNPNKFREYNPDIWRNRAVTDIFEPGLLFSPLFGAVGIHSGIIAPGEIKDIITKGSNIGILKIGEKMGKKAIYECIDAFGFDKTTGIDLPGEARGKIRFRKEMPENSEQAVFYLGQGVAVTPIQLLTAYSAIFNGGNLMKPFIVKRIVDADGKVIKQGQPQIVKRVLSMGAAKEMKEILKSVVREGTGKTAGIPGYEIAGKPGTAQKPKLDGSDTYFEDKYISSFVGHIDSGDTKNLAILVIIDEPKGKPYGSIGASPVFKKVAIRIFMN